VSKRTYIGNHVFKEAITAPTLLDPDGVDVISGINDDLSNCVLTDGSRDITDLQTALDIRITCSGVITTTSGLVTSITRGTRTITINRDVDDIVTGWEDSNYEWTLTRDDDGRVISWGVTPK
jgi:hypothetical protein